MARRRGASRILFTRHLAHTSVHDRSGAADDAAHKIYIWDLAREGLLASTLDGGRELLTYVHVCYLGSLHIIFADRTRCSGIHTNPR